MKKNNYLSQKIKNYLRVLGPGLITGASDDDPSGIATYSQAGARFGTKLLWTALFTYPLMAALQQMCARVGLVTGKGLTGIIKRHYPKKILYLILLISFPSITMNIGADIAGMGAVGNLLVPQVPSFVFAVFFTGVLMVSFIFFSYRRIATILKWLCIALFSYILIPFLTGTNWLSVLKNAVIPKFENSAAYFMALVGILGTTISPYLFFWQTSMEVEEVEEKKIIIDKSIIADMKVDVNGGILFSNFVFFFIILATGTVLFNAGIHQINTVEEAAQALKPLAGKMAYTLFAVGVIGTGLLAIPVLAGASSYMIAETFGWEEGLNKKFHEAKGFYITMIISLVLGLLMQFLGISPIQALVYTAVLYGITAPVLISLLLHICNNKKIMGEFTNKPLPNILGVITLLLMTAAAVILLYLQFFK